MKWRKVTGVVVALIIILFAFSIPTALSAGLKAEPLPTVEKQEEITVQVEQAILEAIAINSNYMQGGMAANLQVTEINISQDQNWATAWVVSYDLQIEAILPTEPALVVTHIVDNAWQVIFPSDPAWQDLIYALPDDLLSKEEKDMWVAMNQGAVEIISDTKRISPSLAWRSNSISFSECWP